MKSVVFVSFVSAVWVDIKISGKPVRRPSETSSNSGLNPKPRNPQPPSKTLNPKSKSLNPKFKILNQTSSTSGQELTASSPSAASFPGTSVVRRRSQTLVAGLGGSL